MTNNLHLPRAGALWALACLWLAACGGPPATDIHAVKSLASNSSNDGVADEQPAAGLSDVEQLATSHRDLNDMLGVHSETSALTPTTYLWVENPELREAALEIIINSGSTKYEQELALVMTDADAEIRETAVDLLADRGGAFAVQLLRHALYDPHASVRQAALEGLQELGAEP